MAEGSVKQQDDHVEEIPVGAIELSREYPAPPQYGRKLPNYVNLLASFP